MAVKLYDQVALKQDIEGTPLRRGDVAVLVDRVAHPSGGEEGCVLEVFNAVGESLQVVAVPASAVEPLRRDEVLSVRQFATAVTC